MERSFVPHFTCLRSDLFPIIHFFKTVCLSGLLDHGFPGFLNFRAFNILVESHEPIDHAAGSDLDNSVYHGIQELVVMGGEKNHLLEIEQAFI